MNSFEKTFSNLRRMHRHGLISLLLATSLTGCASAPPTSVKTTPDYKPEFLECVAAEHDAKLYGACTEQVVIDWCTMIGC